VTVDTCGRTFGRDAAVYGSIERSVGSGMRDPAVLVRNTAVGLATVCAGIGEQVDAYTATCPQHAQHAAEKQ
jgi:hypothetical protein